MKHYYSLSACADSIEQLSDRANKSSPPKMRASELEEHTARVKQIIDMLRDPRESSVIISALAQLRGGAAT